MVLNTPAIDSDAILIFEDHTTTQPDEILHTLELYKVDIRYRNNNLNAGKVSKLDDPLEELNRQKPPKRKRISYYSEKSKKNFKFHLRNTSHLWSHEAEAGYPSEYPLNGRLVKYHRKLLLESLERMYSGINWAWRLGFQERGAPHIHFLFDRFVDYRWLRETWARIVGSSDPSHLLAGTHVDKIRNVGKMIHYMVNYMADDPETLVPVGFENVGRFWGMKTGIIEKELIQKILPAPAAAREMRLVKRWYKAEVRNWAEDRVKKGGHFFKWKPRPGVGFTAIGGRRIVDELMRRGILTP